MKLRTDSIPRSQAPRRPPPALGKTNNRTRSNSEPPPPAPPLHRTHRPVHARVGRRSRGGVAGHQERGVFQRLGLREPLRVARTDPAVQQHGLLVARQYLRARLFSTKAATHLHGNSRRSRGVAATHLHGISTSQPRRRRDSSPRNVHVAATASPRPISGRSPDDPHRRHFKYVVLVGSLQDSYVPMHTAQASIPKPAEVDRRVIADSYRDRAEVSRLGRRRLRGMSTSWPRRRRDPSSSRRNRVSVVAASAECARRGRGVAEPQVRRNDI